MTSGCIFTNSTNFKLFSFSFEKVFFQLSIPEEHLYLWKTPHNCVGFVEKTGVFSEHVPRTVRTVSVHTLTRMDVLKEVPWLTSGGFLGSNLPVTPLLELRTNVAHESTEVGNTEARSSLRWGESLTRSEVVDDTTLLAESTISHNKESPRVQVSNFGSSTRLLPFVSYANYIRCQSFVKCFS